MAKGPIVTPEVEAFIASVYKEHPKWKAKEVHNEVSHNLHKKDAKLPPGWPGLSTVQKVLATVRKSIKETPLDPQDKSWSMGTLDEYPIPPDAIPAVLKVWASRQKKEESFTIREAKWTARLSHFILDIEYLEKIMGNYARTELMYRLIGEPFDSTTADQALMRLIVKVNDPGAPFAFLAVQEDGLDQVRDLAKGKSNKIR